MVDTRIEQLIQRRTLLNTTPQSLRHASLLFISGWIRGQLDQDNWRKMQGGDAGSIASIIIDFVVVVQVGSYNPYICEYIIYRAKTLSVIICSGLGLGYHHGLSFCCVSIIALLSLNDKNPSYHQHHMSCLEKPNLLISSTTGTGPSTTSGLQLPSSSCTFPASPSSLQRWEHLRKVLGEKAI